MSNFYWVVDYTLKIVQGPFLAIEEASMVQGYQLQAFPENEVRVVSSDVAWLSEEQVPAPVYPDEPIDITQPSDPTPAPDEPVP